MSTKKIFMIIVLIVFIVVIIVALANTNNKSLEKLNNISNSSKNTVSADNMIYTETLQDYSKIRKSKEKAKIDVKNMVEITDNYFIEQTNDVFFNLNDYLGKSIKIEGLIYSYVDSNGNICYAVVRNTPGCCGNDGLAGLDIRYDEDYPAENTWVEVTGVVETDIIDGTEIPAIQVSSMTIKEKGKSFVTN